jgi:hypothetical protein
LEEALIMISQRQRPLRVLPAPMKDRRNRL